MSINSVSNSSPIQQVIAKPIRREIATDGPTTEAPADKVEISGVSHLLAVLKTSDIRADKVADIRAQIEAGKYITDDKLDIAADRLLDDLLK